MVLVLSAFRQNQHAEASASGFFDGLVLADPDEFQPLFHLVYDL